MKRFLCVLFLMGLFLPQAGANGNAAFRGRAVSVRVGGGGFTAFNNRQFFNQRNVIQFQRNHHHVDAFRFRQRAIVYAAPFVQSYSYVNPILTQSFSGGHCGGASYSGYSAFSGGCQQGYSGGCGGTSAAVASLSQENQLLREQIGLLREAGQLRQSPR